MRRLLLVLLFCVLSVPASAVQPDEILKDPTLEARAREVGKELRCLVCQNQAISESHAPLARDLRVVLRERIAAGDSDTAALDYMVQRYGDWVLLDPPFKMKTLILWLGPLIILIPGLIIVFVFLRRRSSPLATASVAPALDTAEQEELKRALTDRE